MTCTSGRVQSSLIDGSKYFSDGDSCNVPLLFHTWTLDLAEYSLHTDALMKVVVLPDVDGVISGSTLTPLVCSAWSGWEGRQTACAKAFQKKHHLQFISNVRTQSLLVFASEFLTTASFVGAIPIFCHRVITRHNAGHSRRQGDGPPRIYVSDQRQNSGRQEPRCKLKTMHTGLRNTRTIIPEVMVF